MRTIIAGYQGFIGQELTRQLSPVHNNWIGIDRDSASKHPKIAKFTDTSMKEERSFDWEDDEKLIATTKGHEIFINLISRTHKTKEQASEEELDEVYLSENLGPALKLADAAISANASRYIYVSSIKANGESTNGSPFTNKSPCKPEDSYGKAKYATEKALERRFATTKTKLIIIRPPLVYGRNNKGHLASLDNLIKRGIPFPFKDIKNQRSLIGVKNLCDLIMYCMEMPLNQKTTLILAADHHLSTPEIIKKVGHAQQHSVKLMSFPPMLLHYSAKLLAKQEIHQKLAGDLRVMLSAESPDFDWFPPFSFEENYI